MKNQHGFKGMVSEKPPQRLEEGQETKHWRETTKYFCPMKAKLFPSLKSNWKKDDHLLIFLFLCLREDRSPQDALVYKQKETYILGSGGKEKI